MKKLIGLLGLIIAITFFTGCDNPPPKQSPQPAPAIVVPIEKPKPDVSTIIENAKEIREEKLFLVTLSFQKERLTLDPWEHIKNGMATEYRTIIVSEREFSGYQINQKISGVSDGWNLVFNGEIAEYVVRVNKKTTTSQYFWINENGTQTEISKEQYNEAIQQLQANNRQFVTVPFAGIVKTYILEKPLAEYKFVEHQPLNRYFVTIRIQNSTLTLDFVKQLRNASNTHDITLEIPAEIYEKTDKVWDVQLSGGSLIFKGHLSELNGNVIKKWTEVDNNYQLAKTSDGQSFIIPK